MKKNLFALSAVALLAGAAHADVVVNPRFINNPVALEQQASGIGHILTVPYFSTQGGNTTTLNITNTDTVNGKAVKVRYRSARNSDDVFDFTLYLSPGDVWSGTVTQDASGVSKISSGDTSITVPRNSQLYGHVVSGGRDQSLFSAERAGGRIGDTREGYIEIINTADVPLNRANFPGLTTQSNDLWDAIKHGPEGQSPDANTVSSAQSLVERHHQAGANIVGWADLTSAGYSFPTGGIFANWFILNVGNGSVNSGEAVAISPADGGAGNFVLFPQNDADYNRPVAAVTADPLLRKATLADQGFVAQFFDFPDLSTPYTQVLGATSTLVEPVAPTVPNPVDYGFTDVTVQVTAAGGAAEQQTEATRIGATRVELLINGGGSGGVQLGWFIIGPGANGAGWVTAHNDYVTDYNQYIADLAVWRAALDAAQQAARNRVAVLGSDLQANQLSWEFAVPRVINEYSYNSAVDLQTEWLLSSPTRRYAVAVDYENSAIVANPTSHFWQAKPATDYNVELNSEDTIVVVKTIAGIDLWNREEVLNNAPLVSPGAVRTAYTLPGEVSTIKFNIGGDATAFSVLGAQIATQAVDLTTAPGVGNATFNSGWASINFNNPVRFNRTNSVSATLERVVQLPVYGYSATSANGGFSVGTTWNHRY